MKKLFILLVLTAFLATACDLNPNSNDPDVKNWQLIENSAKDSIVTVVIDHSNPLVVEWFKNQFADYLKSNYSIELKVIDQPILKTYETLNDELLHETEFGQYDIVIIEKTGFKSMFEKGTLYGPFKDKLPNAKAYLNSSDLEVEYNEGIETQNYTVPIGRSQLSFIYNQDVFYDPPVTFDDFFEIVKTNKGAFTYPDPRNSLEGEAFIISVIAQYVDMDKMILLTSNEAEIEKAVMPGLDVLKALKPYIYKKGTEYPSSTQAFDQLFSDGTLVMSMTMNYNYVTEKLKAYEYPEFANAFTLSSGTTGYVEYAVIPFDSPNKSGAMVAINALLSPEMQGSKYDPKYWGSLPVFNPETAPDEAYTDIKKIRLKSTTVKQDALLNNRIPEFNASSRKVIVKLWEKYVLNNN